MPQQGDTQAMKRFSHLFLLPSFLSHLHSRCSQPASPSGFGYGRTDPGFFRDGRAGLWESGFPKKKARPGLGDLQAFAD